MFLLNIYDVSGTVTGAWGTSVNKKNKILALMEHTFQQNQSEIVPSFLRSFLSFLFFFFKRKSMDLSVREGLGQITNPNQPDDLWASYFTP